MVLSPSRGYFALHVLFRGFSADGIVNVRLVGCDPSQERIGVALLLFRYEFGASSPDLATHVRLQEIAQVRRLAHQRRVLMDGESFRPVERIVFDLVAGNTDTHALHILENATREFLLQLRGQTLEYLDIRKLTARDSLYFPPRPALENLARGIQDLSVVGRNDEAGFVGNR